MNGFPLIIACFTLMLSSFAGNLLGAKAQEIGRSDLQAVKAGFVFDHSGGRGALLYEGAAYPLHMDGIGLEPCIVVSTCDFSGTVYNLTDPEDIYGDYRLASGATLVGDGNVATLTNARGVQIELKARATGMRTIFVLNGIIILPR
jgi:hypothetical protein